MKPTRQQLYDFYIETRNELKETLCSHTFICDEYKQKFKIDPNKDDLKEVYKYRTKEPTTSFSTWYHNVSNRINGLDKAISDMNKEQKYYKTTAKIKGMIEEYYCKSFSRMEAAIKAHDHWKGLGNTPINIKTKEHKLPKIKI